MPNMLDLSGQFNRLKLFWLRIRIVAVKLPGKNLQDGGGNACEVCAQNDWRYRSTRDNELNHNECYLTMLWVCVI